MIIRPPKHIDMHRHPGPLAETLQTMRHHLAAEIAELLALEPELGDAEGAVRQVDDGARERLIQRGVGVAETREPGGRAEGGLEGGAERDERVLCAVVVVDVQVAAAHELQRPPGVLGQGVQHVV